MNEELFSIAEKIKELIERIENSDAMQELLAVENAAKKTGRSFSGSWLGYHSRVYYDNFTPPPSGAFFSQEWGVRNNDYFGHGSQGNWVECDPEDVIQHILAESGNHDLSNIAARMKPFHGEYKRYKDGIESILSTANDEYSDKYLSKVLKKIQEQAFPTQHAILESLSPKGNLVSRDMAAISQGIMNPPHFIVLSAIFIHKVAIEQYHSGLDIALKSASHIERLNMKKRKQNKIGTNIFIGHGQSKLWRDFKDFLQDRLNLPWDEFNRVPVAGVTNIARLSEMLDSACIAFLVLTAEDEMADGTVQARMNVIHEAGLFQGRLGFTRAIVVLEEGCEEFSNIEGLGQLRFPKGNITAIFEDVRRVLEREQIIDD